MGKRGPKPKSNAARARDGNAGKRSNPAEPTPAPASSSTGGPASSTAAAAPDAPDYLGPIARAKWLELAPRLVALGLLTELDLDAFAVYCIAWQDVHEADAAIAKEGAYFTTEKGYVGVHPAVMARNRALDRLRKVGGDFGMTPASRSGVEADRPGERSELDAFLAGA